MSEWLILLAVGAVVAVLVPLALGARAFVAGTGAAALLLIFIVAATALMGYPVRRDPVDGSVVYGAQEDAVMAKEPGGDTRLFRSAAIADALREKQADGADGPMSLTRGQNGELDLMPFTPLALQKDASR